MNRRDFLRGAAAVGGAAVLGNRVSAWAQGPPATTDVVAQLAGSILNNPATASPIDTIVVLMMENRSFDHYFGWLATDESYLEAGRSRYGPDFGVDGTLDLTYLRVDGSEAPTYHLPGWSESQNPYRGCGGHPDPGHGWESGRAQRDHGFVAEGTENDDFAIGYFLEDDLPCYRQLARNCTVFDRYFASLMASTYPNREYMHSAQSGGLRDNYLPLKELGFPWPTIWDRLVAAGVPGGMYAVDLPTTLLWGARMLPITHPIVQLFADAALGTLPNVTFVDPGFLTGLRTDDHPHGDMRMGQRFVAQILQTLQASPQWERMAMFVTYDEWGGFFDHVTPPVFVDDRGSVDDANNYGQGGFRLPVSLVSPFARPGYVDHREYDHTSILRLIEWRFLG
ncbi:MAG: alkaline phosphatase family protein, partial [Acidimicrobiales bacterium]